MPVPKELIGHVFIKVRGRIPGNFAIRPSRNLVRNERLFALLNGGQLVVREGEFRRWVRSQRKKRRWPSQQKAQCSKNPVGRPSKLTVQLKGAILDIIGQQAWHGKRPLAALHRLLVERGLVAPSVDTIGRMIDDMFMEIGDARFRRRRRIRRK